VVGSSTPRKDQHFQRAPLSVEGKNAFGGGGEEDSRLCLLGRKE